MRYGPGREDRQRRRFAARRDRGDGDERSRALVLEGGHPLPYFLLYGARGLDAPNYEFARIPFAQSRTTVTGVLGPEGANPAFDAPGEPFGERYRWLVQVSLALAALVVASAGFLAFRRRV
jgi:hypothetical protein